MFLDILSAFWLVGPAMAYEHVGWAWTGRLRRGPCVDRPVLVDE